MNNSVARSHAPIRLLLTLILASALAPVASCRSASSPYAPQAEAVRSPIQAERLTQRAAELLDEPSLDLDKAEKLLREALAADLYHGPAHNNLGVVYLKQGKLYEAAGEFEWARKLMPGHPDPRINLALTLERAGRIDDAADAYASALEVYPGHVPALQGLTRLDLKHNRASDLTSLRLRTISLEGTSPQWREWARRKLVAIDH